MRRILLQASGNDRGEGGRHRRRTGPRRPARDGGGKIVGVLAFEGSPAGQHLVQEHTERPDVRARRQRSAADRLRRHVRQRAGDLADAGARSRERLGGRRLERARQAEIDQLELSRRRHQHVLHLEVSVHDAVLVGVRQRARGLDSVAQHRVGRQAGRADDVAQRPALHELHRDEGRTIDVAHIEDSADVRMIQGRSGPRLGQQAAGAPARSSRSTFTQTSRPRTGSWAR